MLFRQIVCIITFKNILIFCQGMNKRPNWQRDLAWIKATAVEEKQTVRAAMKT